MEDVKERLTVQTIIRLENIVSILVLMEDVKELFTFGFLQGVRSKFQSLF